MRSRSRILTRSEEQDSGTHPSPKQDLHFPATQHVLRKSENRNKYGRVGERVILPLLRTIEEFESIVLVGIVAELPEVEVPGRGHAWSQ
jgi:hypothetical protein